MGFFDRLKSLLMGETKPQHYYIYVRCRRCGEPIKAHLDLLTSLARDDSGNYMVRKTLVGNRRCFERVEVTLYFDANREVIDQTISGGDFITAEAYNADNNT